MPLDVSLAELIRGAIDSRLLDLHTALPARVVTYDREKQVADCEVMIRHPAPLEDGGVLLETYPVIPNVPVAWPRGGGYSLQFPLAADDHVLLVFNEADISRWRTTGALAAPGDLSRHSLSYPYAIPCAAPDADALDTVSGGALPTDPGNEAVIDGPTTIRVGGTSADFVALAAKVNANFDALKNVIASLVPAVTPGDGGAALFVALQGAFAALTIDDVKSTKLKGE